MSHADSELSLFSETLSRQINFNDAFVQFHESFFGKPIH